MDMKQGRVDGRKPGFPDEEGSKHRDQRGSGPFAGTVPHGDDQPTHVGERGNRKVAPRSGSDGNVPHEQSENSPMRPRQSGMSPAKRGRTDKSHKEQD